MDGPGERDAWPNSDHPIADRESKCGECGEELGRHAWITLQGQKGAVCLSCADLDHLVYLPSGDTTLTRRARRHSRLSAVVLKWSRARKRYERQGLLVGERALKDAEAECVADCVADKDAREAARIRAADRRAEMDEQSVSPFARRVRELFPPVPIRVSLTGWIGNRETGPLGGGAGKRRGCESHRP
jgi:hypothetical protein